MKFKGNRCVILEKFSKSNKIHVIAVRKKIVRREREGSGHKRLMNVKSYIRWERNYGLRCYWASEYEDSHRNKMTRRKKIPPIVRLFKG